MENSEQRLTCAEARKFDMVDYLSSIGHEPKRVRGNNYWYLSPLREENTPSFKVDRKLNVWADWGSVPGHFKGKVAGGNLIDFGVLYHRCTVGEFLNRLENGHGRLLLPFVLLQPAAKKEAESGKITILKDVPLAHPALLGYLRERRIPYHTADAYCREVHFSLYDKSYFAIGFKNNSGGFELRNQFFKGSSSPKSFTHLKEGQDPAAEVCVFEGFFNFLTYLTLMPPDERAGKDMLILNSLSFLSVALTIMEDYSGVKLFLDRNGPGRKATAIACAIDKIRYQDKSDLYKNYEDFNQLLCNFGKTQKPRHKLSP
jgi:hypothetical protein